VYEFGEDIIQEVTQKVCDNLEMDVPGCEHKQACSPEHPSSRLSELHHRMQNIILEDESNAKFLIDITSQEIIYELLKSNMSNKIVHNHKSHPINKAIQIMCSSYGAHMSISELAEEVGMTLSSFSQKFKLITRISPQEYLKKQRLLQSKNYLKQMSVTETAYEVGYDSISHYIRLFKKEFGITPKQYQLQSRARE
jgi:AraC-like DNA-binding protein